MGIIESDMATFGTSDMALIWLHFVGMIERMFGNIIEIIV